MTFQNPEAEQMILSAILNGHINYLDEMEVEDFSIPSHERIFKAMLKLRDNNTPIDIVTIGTTLKGTGLMETIFKINEAYFRGDNFEISKNIIKQNTFKRRLQRAILCIKEELKKDNIATIKSNVLQFINDIPLPGNNKDDSLKSILVETLEDLEKLYNNKDDDKKQTGIADLDAAMGGLHDDEVTILAARPAVGKTALALQIMLNLARKGNKIMLFSREMSQKRNAKRLISNEGSIDGQKIRTGKFNDRDWQKIIMACNELSKLDVYINDTAATVPEIRAICREKKQKEGLDLIIIDYLQLLRNVNKHDTREREVAEMSRAIKEMNLELNIPVLLLSQLSRSAANKRPTLDTLRESGAIEQDADNVILLHEPTEEQLNTQDEKDMYREITQSGNKYIEVIIAKQRDGRTGMFVMQYISKYLQFHSIFKGE